MFGDRMTQLHGSQVVLQLMSEADVDAITEILADPQVAMWWGQWDRERVKEEFTDSDLGVYVIRPLIDGEPGPVIGSAQYFEESSAPTLNMPGWMSSLTGATGAKAMELMSFVRCAATSFTTAATIALWLTPMPVTKRLLPHGRVWAFVKWGSCA